METRESESQRVENPVDIVLPYDTVSVFAPIVTTLVNYEISTGERSNEYDPKNPENNDIIDEVHRSLNVANTKKEYVVLNLTPGEWSEIERHISEAAKNKAFAVKDLIELKDISRRINAAFTQEPTKEEKKLDSFGVGPNSALYSWAKRRAEKGSRDGLG